MRRREFIALVVGAIVCPLGVRAQPQAGKVPRIGFLGVTSSSDRPSLLDAFRQGLHSLGWVEGQNIAIDYRFAEGRLDRLPDLAAELVRLKVDLIVSFGTQGVTAAKSATVNAAGSSGRIRSARNGGTANAGKPFGMPPNFEPIVSTGS